MKEKNFSEYFFIFPIQSNILETECYVFVYMKISYCEVYQEICISLIFQNLNLSQKWPVGVLWDGVHWDMSQSSFQL